MTKKKKKPNQISIECIFQFVLCSIGWWRDREKVYINDDRFCYWIVWLCGGATTSMNCFFKKLISPVVKIELIHRHTHTHTLNKLPYWLLVFGYVLSMRQQTKWQKCYSKNALPTIYGQKISNHLFVWCSQCVVCLYMKQKTKKNSTSCFIYLKRSALEWNRLNT